MIDLELDIIKRAAQSLVDKGYVHRLYEASDLYAAGWEAVSEYRGDILEKGLLFNVVRYRMIDYLRKLRRHRTDNFYSPCYLDRERSNDKALWDSSFAEHIKNAEAFEDRIKALTPTERRMVRMYFVEDTHYKEIAEFMGLTESRICQIFNDTIYPTLRKNRELIR